MKNRRVNPGPPSGAPLVGCLLILLLGCVVIWMLATLIHYLGPVWLFAILLGVIVVLMGITGD